VVRLECADIREVGPWAGEYDYIIAHGVFSWVPLDVQTALLDGIARHLAPEGVAFVSYLAQPGAQLREMLRLMLRFHTGAAPDPQTRLQQSRALLRLLAKGSSEESAYRTALLAQITPLETRPDAALFHDELSGESHPFLFAEFIRAAEERGLSFLCEAEYLVPTVQGLTDEARDQLRPLVNNRVLLEQYLDFIEGRRFRQTLLCRAGRGVELECERLSSLHLTLRARVVPESNADLSSVEPLEAVSSGRSFLEARASVEKAAILELATHAGSTSFPALLDGVRRRLAAANVGDDAWSVEELQRFLIRASLPKLLDLSREEPRRAFTRPLRPRASVLARWQLEKGQRILFSLTGDGVSLQDELSRHLLLLLDGTRGEAEIVAALSAFVQARADDPDIRKALAGGLPFETLVRQALDSFAAMALLHRDDD
jgi:hypothetical protein